MKKRKAWFLGLLSAVAVFTTIAVVEVNANTAVNIADGTLKIEDSGTYEVTGTTDKNHITVKSGNNPTIIINDLNIDLCNEKDDGKSQEAAAISIEDNCNVTLVIKGHNVLYGGNHTGIGANWGYAGINIDKGGSLTITGDEDGRLEVHGGGDYGGAEEGGAGIEAMPIMIWALLS